MTSKSKGPLAGGPKYLRAFERLYGAKCTSSAAAGIDPAEYYMAELGKLHIRGEWADALCPFHDDKTPSLSINLNHGAFKCHACRVSGGDVIDFHRKRYGMSFKAACAALGVHRD